MFLNNRNISSKIKRSKVTDYAALSQLFFNLVAASRVDYLGYSVIAYTSGHLMKVFRIIPEFRILRLTFP